MAPFRLTIQRENGTKECFIHKDSFWISNLNPEAECFIEDNSVEISLHVFKEGDSFFILNENNSPFIALNNLPFRKKELKKEDVLTFGKTEIKILAVFTEDKKEDTKVLTTPENPLEAPKTIPSFSLEDLWKNEEIKEKISPFATADAFSPKQKQENNNASQNGKEKTDFLSSFPIGIKKLIGSLLVFCLAALFLSLGFYSKALHSNKEEEKRAAGGVADVSMALLYGQLNHIKPPKHNFSDPTFIRNNLKEVLSQGYPSLGEIDLNRQLGGTSYILRIYTSQDSSRYLIIAQPAHNLFQLLIPKTTIALDSSQMQLHKIEDIKTLNRLLANPNPLDNIHGNNIGEFLLSCPTISLASLGVKKDARGFLIPKNIQDKLPSEFVYNAPRYAPLTKSVLNKAYLLNENKLDKDEFIILQEEIDKFNALKNLVFYTTQGSQKGWQSLQALTTFFPKETFIVSALTTNPDGTFSPHALLLEETAYNDNPIAFNDPLQAHKESAVPYHSDSLNYIDVNHPLYFKLYALKMKREQELNPLKEEIISLLYENNETYVPDFMDHFDHLVTEYRKATVEQNKTLFLQIEELYQEYKEISFDIFLNYLKAFQMQEMAEDMALQNPDTPSSDLKKEMGKIRTEKLFQETKAKLL